MANITRLTVLKLAELILVILLIQLHYSSFQEYYDRKMEDEKDDLMDEFFMATAIFGGFFVVLIGLFAGDVMETSVPRRVDIFYSLAGYASFLCIGAVIISNHRLELHECKQRDLMMWKGSISIILGFLFVFDAFLTYKGYK